MSVENMTPERGDRLIELAKAIDSAGRQGENAGRLEAHTQFHLLLFEGADFPALKQMIDVVWARFPFTDLLSVPGIPSAHDHFVIADLARAGDVDGATEALRMHLRSVPVYFDASLANRHPVDSGAELVANRTIAHPRRFRYVGGPGLPKR
jgi:DNA-binding GntR family transcriptional regulator